MIEDLCLGFQPWVILTFMMKRCCACKSEQPIENFNRNKCRKDGLQSRCRPCDQHRAREKYRGSSIEQEKTKLRSKTLSDSNNEFVYALLLVSKCVTCGENDPATLDFDHLVPEDKHLNVSRMKKHSRKTLEAEIAKCQIICANCHRKKTAKQFGWYRRCVS